jgi:MYXO-CTERM domain-containing protein
VAGQIPSCWNLGPCGQAFTVQNQSVQCDVRVQDLVGAENEPPNPATQVSFGPEACNAQASFAPVALNVWFVPVDSLGNLSGTAYSYAIPSDLVGPPPPAVGTPGIGDTLLLLNWTANTDSDTAGYDIFMDPPPGTNPTFIPTLFCPDGSAASSTSSATTSASTSSTSSSSLDDGSADDGAIDDASDTGVSATTSSSATSSTTASSSAAATSAACYYVGGNSSVGGSGCNSTVLAESASTLDSGSETVVDVTDEAGDIIDSSVTFGIGGHSNLLCDYLVGTGCTKGQPAYTAQNTSVAGESGTHFNITQLQNSFLYNIAVAAVDNSGNVGPQSPVVCQTPLPVDDFFKVYRQSGGGAGGNFCSLDAVGDPAASSIASAGALGVGALAFGRRRRRRKGR